MNRAFLLKFHPTTSSSLKVQSNCTNYSKRVMSARRNSMSVPTSSLELIGGQLIISDAQYAFDKTGSLGTALQKTDP